MPPTPKPILIAALVISALVGLTGVYGAWSAISSGAWFAIGFEIVLVAACVFGVLTGLGRFRESHAYALICVAGAVLVCACLAFIASDADVAANAQLGLLVRAMPRDPLTGARLAAAGLLAALAGLTLLVRTPRRSLRYLGLAAALGAGPVLAVVAFLNPMIRGYASEIHTVALSVILFIGVLLVGGLASASAHCFIRAFEVGRVDPERRDPGGRSA